MSNHDQQRLGYWLSEKKSKKLSIPDIEEALRAKNIEPVKIDLQKPLSTQGPFDGILHKLTEFIAQGELGNIQAQELMESFQEYTAQNPKTIVMDSFDCLRTIINRFETYSLIENCLKPQESSIGGFIPSFVALRSNDFDENVRLVRLAGIKFPAVCKPIVAHGSVSAHQVRPVLARLMTLVFNENGLRQAAFPCVVQSFVNHNAILYKIFVLGDRYFQVERPSIKNFHDSDDLLPIHFDGGEVSKSNSSSQLNFQDWPDSETSQNAVKRPCPKVLNLIAREISEAMGLRLIGVDAVVEASSGRIAIVDVNAFPGYDGVEDFPQRLAEFVRHELDTKSYSLRNDIQSKTLPNGEVITKPSEPEPTSRLINQTSMV